MFELAKKKKIGENFERVRLKKGRKKLTKRWKKKIRSCDLRRFPYAYEGRGSS